MYARGLWILGLLAMAPGCASANGDAGVDEENVGTSEDAIRRGLPTSLNNVVRLYLSNGGICSGVLLSSRIVLTAAHCNTNTLSTRVGLSSTATVGVVDYLYSAGADWMLMKLASPGLSGASCRSRPPLPLRMRRTRSPATAMTEPRAARSSQEAPSPQAGKSRAPSMAARARSTSTRQRA